MINFVFHKTKYYFVPIFLLLIQSCTSIPHKPLVEGITTAIAPNFFPNVTNGSLFQERSLEHHGYKSLFEDYRPHNIGDTLTVILQEEISASNSSTSNASRDGTNNIGMEIIPSGLSPILGLDLKKNQIGLNNTGKHDFFGKGNNTAENKFSGLITVTIKTILPNGNLKVIGEKQVGINDGVEYIRFSGVVNPNNINNNNFVQSSRIADARIEYSRYGWVNQMQHMGWMQKLLLKFSPI
ncbi:flagellar basal body L-ring protein [Buchnera aphidicola (Hyadaphis tataricae)]|uniref:Flagellar L-ring protein n=1 Tax=Buchnera aphidicola (Hyadaphis tataricae) TaxID=1241859 RepID=A0A4D6Y6S9_9GAMM|nr:flagellar basal body L-ring protein FlgH [Buchnera aphidicola]QCI21640.1 flagellar basal body L-ring protein [Buchnera aphidicola (Hyadaphis tataricae)]